MTRTAFFIVAMLSMAAVIVASNVLVQYPLGGTLSMGSIGSLALGDLLTWGAFTFPLAFLITDFANRAFGAARARQVVLVGFAVAVVLSFVFATPRIALASGASFLIAQMLDVQLFAHLHRGERKVIWWQPPAISSFFGSMIDTALFFTLAFAAFLTPLVGYGDGFATEVAPLFGLLAIEAPRWVSWALGDLSIKLLAIPVLLFPYRLLLSATGLDAKRGLAA